MTEPFPQGIPQFRHPGSRSISRRTNRRGTKKTNLNTTACPHSLHNIRPAGIEPTGLFYWCFKPAAAASRGSRLRGAPPLGPTRKPILKDTDIAIKHVIERTNKQTNNNSNNSNSSNSNNNSNNNTNNNNNNNNNKNKNNSSSSNNQLSGCCCCCCCCCCYCCCYADYLNASKDNHGQNYESVCIVCR